MLGDPRKEFRMPIIFWDETIIQALDESLNKK
jgi:hypothetical protein